MGVKQQLSMLKWYLHKVCMHDRIFLKVPQKIFAELLIKCLQIYAVYWNKKLVNWHSPMFAAHIGWIWWDKDTLYNFLYPLWREFMH